MLVHISSGDMYDTGHPLAPMFAMNIVLDVERYRGKGLNLTFV